VELHPDGRHLASRLSSSGQVSRKILPRRRPATGFFPLRSLAEATHLTFPAGHFISRDIQNSEEFQRLIKRIVDDAPQGYHQLSTKPAFSSVSFRSSRDLFLGIHAASVNYRGSICKLSDSTYFLDLKATVGDHYDFHLLISAYYSGGYKATVANNMAWSDQALGVIRRYRWEATIHEMQLSAGRF
jgi:hypothetical protein